MADISSIKLPSGNTYDVKDILGRQSIPYGMVTSNSTTVFTATVDGVTQLSNGVCCLIRNNNKQTSASGWTLNVNDLGAKPVYNNMADASRETTIFNKVYTMLFVYDEDRVDGGCWICYKGYDSNTNTIGYQLRTNSTVMNVSDTARYYKLYFMSADNTMWVPASVNSTNNATSARPVNQRPINPFGRIVYTSANTNYTAGSNLAATTIWDQYAFSLGYSFNRTGAALTMTVEAPVYVKCAPQSDGSAIMDATTPIVQALPSTADGKIYIYLGVAYSAVNIELVPHHPVYYHDGTAIRLWTGASGGSSSVAWNDITGKPTFATVATSGSYNDLSNKPTIPSAVTESTVAGWGFTKNTGTYSKPSGGIPKTDLAGAVQTSLGKADTALQSYTESDPVFTASAAHGITSANITSWNNKGTYSKPSGGIPKTDLASAVQTSLGKADTALQSYTETDPTVPSWAKASSKPTYTASEVGALPDTTAIPTNTSDLTNDSGFITGMTILSYGNSTWADFEAAYNANKIVYCRASSNANPASGSQTRLAFMAYVNNATTPTNVEFQYYRSVSTHTASQQGDQVFVYKLDKTSGWSVIIREASVKVVAGDGLGGTYSNGTMTLTGPTKVSDLTNDSGFITSYTETDPTVPSWAKASSKPSYTASEVGAAASSHTHGNITNSGDITTNATIASGDRIIINDESASKITNSSITFGSSTTQYLANNGTWQNVPTVPTKTSDLTNDSGFITSESDPVFSASAAHGITSTDITNWNGKSDFSGNYNDLTNKPTIPAAVTESTVAGWGFTKNTGTYSKPSGGIPKTDLASAVQTSLGKADTALQSYTESDPIFTASAAHGITSTNITNWNNKISEPASEGTNGQVLMTNGSGTRTWGSVSTADEKIKLTSQSTSGNYPLIFGPTSITSNSTYQGYYNTGITINPNTKAVTATTFVGALTGTASGNLTSSSTLDASKLSGAIPSAVTATTQTSTDNSTKIATTAFVKTAIANAGDNNFTTGSYTDINGNTVTALYQILT